MICPANQGLACELVCTKVRARESFFRAGEKVEHLHANTHRSGVRSRAVVRLPHVFCRVLIRTCGADPHGRCALLRAGRRDCLRCRTASVGVEVARCVRTKGRPLFWGGPARVESRCGSARMVQVTLLDIRLPSSGLEAPSSRHSTPLACWNSRHAVLRGEDGKSGLLSGRPSSRPHRLTLPSIVCVSGTFEAT